MLFNRFPSSPSVTSLFSTVPECHLKPPPPAHPHPSPASRSVLTSVALQRSGVLLRAPAPSQHLPLFSTNPAPRRTWKRRQSKREGQQTTWRGADAFVAPRAVRLAVVLQVVVPLRLFSLFFVHPASRSSVFCFSFNSASATHLHLRNYLLHATSPGSFIPANRKNSPCI